MSRGVRQADIFLSEAEMRAYMDLVDHHAPRYEIRVESYALMPNHVHFLVTGRRPQIGEFFKRVHASYAQEFNQLHKLRGHVFEARPLIKPIADRGHYLIASIYIHLNPVKGMGRRLSEYPFSSYLMVIGERPSPRWFDPAPVLRLLDSGEAEARDTYRRLCKNAAASVLSEGRPILLPEKSGPIQAYSDNDVSLIGLLLRESGHAQALSVRTGLPVEIIILYWATRFGLASERRLATLLGISRKRANDHLAMIKRDKYLKGVLNPSGIATYPGLRVKV